MTKKLIAITKDMPAINKLRESTTGKEANGELMDGRRIETRMMRMRRVEKEICGVEDE